MCLTINLDAVKQIAQEDIPCYKLLRVVGFSRNMLASPYRNHPYKIDELVTATIGEVSSALYGWDTRKYVREINEGLHSYTANHVFSLRNYRAIRDAYYFKAIIPKGSEYYEGTFDGEPSYVSNQLIVKDRLAGHSWINVHV